MSVGGRQHNDCHVMLPLGGEPPRSEDSSVHYCPYASPEHTTVGSGLGRLGRGRTRAWLGRSGPGGVHLYSMKMLEVEYLAKRKEG